MAVLTTGNTFSNGDQVTASSLNNAVNDAEFAAGAVDGISTQKSGSGAIIVKDLGISSGKIAIDAVGTDQLANDVVISTSGSITGAAGSFTTLSASGDVTFDTTTLKVDSSNNRVGIGTASPAVPLDVNGQARVVGNLFVGTDDTTPNGMIEVYGGGTGQNEGGEIRLRTAADFDTTYNHYFIDSYQDDLRIGREGGADITLTSDGNVGIGTTSPSSTLHVENTTSSGAYINYDGQSNTEFGLRIESNAAGGNFEGDFANNGSLLDLFANSSVTSGGDILACRTQSATPVMLVRGNGNVGIGTASPQTNLDVSGSASSDIGLQIRAGDAGGQDSTQIAFSYNGSPYNSSGYAHNIRTQHSGSGEADNKISFYLWDFGTDTSSTLGSKHVMSLCGNGNVGIGDASPSYKLDVNGTGRFVGQLTLDDEVLHNISGTQTRLPGYYAGTYGVEIEQTAQGSTIHVGRSDGNCMNIGADATAAGTNLNVVYFRDTGAGVGGPPAVSTEVGKIVINTTSTNYSTSSDYRLKENEVVISDGIDRLKQLNAYRFNFIKEPSKIVDGFFAHEVSSIVPESIVGTKDQVDDEGNPVYQGIDQSKIVPLLTAALQEAVAKIEALEARVESLEG